MWTISKIVFILSHGQSFTERRFSINHEVIDHKRKDLLHRKGLCLMQFIMVVLSYDFQITPALRKSCPLSYQRCKLGLEKNAEEKANNSADLKRKIKHDDTQKVKKQKDGFRSNYQSTLDGLIKKTLLADNNQDLSSTVKADAFCRTLKQKKETLAVLTTAQEKLEGEYKDLLLT